MIESLGQGTQFVKCFGSFYINMAILKACVQDNLHNSNIFLYTIQRLLKISLAQHLKRKKKTTQKKNRNWHNFSFLSWLFTVREQCGQLPVLSQHKTTYKNLWTLLHYGQTFSSQQNSQAADQMSQSQIWIKQRQCFLKSRSLFCLLLQVVPSLFTMSFGKWLVVVTASYFQKQLANEQHKTGTIILEGHPVNQVGYL